VLEHYIQDNYGITVSMKGHSGYMDKVRTSSTSVNIPAYILSAPGEYLTRVGSMDINQCWVFLLDDETSWGTTNLSATYVLRMEMGFAWQRILSGVVHGKFAQGLEPFKSGLSEEEILAAIKEGTDLEPNPEYTNDQKKLMPTRLIVATKSVAKALALPEAQQVSIGPLISYAVKHVIGNTSKGNMFTNFLKRFTRFDRDPARRFPGASPDEAIAEQERISARWEGGDLRIVDLKEPLLKLDPVIQLLNRMLGERFQAYLDYIAKTGRTRAGPSDKVHSSFIPAKGLFLNQADLNDPLQLLLDIVHEYGAYLNLPDEINSSILEGLVWLLVKNLPWQEHIEKSRDELEALLKERWGFGKPEIEELAAVLYPLEFSSQEKGNITLIRAMGILPVVLNFYGSNSLPSGLSYWRYSLLNLFNFEQIIEESADNVKEAGGSFSIEEKQLISWGRIAALLCLLEPIWTEASGVLQSIFAAEDTKKIALLVTGIWRIRELPYNPPQAKEGQGIASNQMEKLIRLAHIENEPNVLILLLAFSGIETSLDIFDMLISETEENYFETLQYLLKEINEVYALLADRILLGGLASRLRDKIYYLTYRQNYNKAREAIARFLTLGDYYRDGKMTVDIIVGLLKERFKELGIHYISVNGRLKDISAILKKIINRRGLIQDYGIDDLISQVSLEKIGDYFSFRIVLKDAADIELAKDAVQNILSEISVPWIAKKEEKMRPQHPYHAWHIDFKDAHHRAYEVVILPTLLDSRIERSGEGARWVFIAQKERSLRGQLFLADAVEPGGNIFTDFVFLWRSFEDYVYPSVAIPLETKERNGRVIDYAWAVKVKKG
ncbi:MAG: hypothetical protein FJZ08_05360, partial [Candidatus Omnitrophica bacterium]|nr:hypothetical protein [Candidatus Omnitrophota bacterium]